MAHELRLMLLLSDEVDTARKRDGEVRLVRAELEQRREGVSAALRELLGGERGESGQGIAQEDRQKEEQMNAQAEEQAEEVVNKQEECKEDSQVVQPVNGRLTEKEKYPEEEEDEEDFEEV